jgi:hypothetical protein
MESKQLAVDWLVEKIKAAKPDFKFDALIREAKEMEKHQIMNAIGVGSYFSPVFPDKYHYRAEDHYTLTYGE